MKLLRAAAYAIAVSVLLTSCATTDSELTPKEREKIARDMERESQKQAQAQAKMMRDATGGGQRSKSSR